MDNDTESILKKQKSKHRSRFDESKQTTEKPSRSRSKEKRRRHRKHRSPSLDNKQKDRKFVNPEYNSTATHSEREIRSVSPSLSLSPHSRRQQDEIFNFTNGRPSSADNLDSISDVSFENEPASRLDTDVDAISDVPLTNSDKQSKTGFDDISDASLIINDERSNRLSTVAPKIKVGTTPTVKAEPIIRSSSPCPTEIKTELRRERSNSREHDFDDLPETNGEIPGSPCSTVIKKEIQRSRSNSREHDFDDILQPVKNEPGSPCPTVIKTEFQRSRSNSREHDFDDIPALNESLPAISRPATIKTEATRSPSNSGRYPIIKSEPRSRSNSVDLDLTTKTGFRATVKIEPRESSPCPTEIKLEPGQSRSNSRERDFDEMSLDERPLRTKQELSKNTWPHEFAKKSEKERTPSPCPTEIKQEPGHNRSTSRERDFDEMSMDERPSRTKQELSNNTWPREIAEKSEKERTPSPCPTEIKQEPGHSRSNSRERDFDDISMDERSLASEQEFSITGRQRDPVKNLVKNERREINKPAASTSDKESAMKRRKHGSEKLVKKERQQAGTSRMSDEANIINYDDFDIPGISTLNDIVPEPSIKHEGRRTNSSKPKKRKRSEKSPGPTLPHKKLNINKSFDSEEAGCSHDISSKRNRHADRSPSPTNFFSIKPRQQMKRYRSSSSSSASSSSHSDVAGPSHRRPRPKSSKSSKYQGNRTKIIPKSESIPKILANNIDNLRKAAATQKCESAPKKTTSHISEVEEAERALMQKARELEQIERLIQLKGNQKIAALDTKILIEKQKTKRELDQFYIDLYGTDNIDDWDDDPALSNVPVAQAIRKQLAMVNHSSQQILPRSMADQLFCREVDNLSIPELNADLKALIVKETDYEKMEIAGRLTEIERRYPASAIPKPLMIRIAAEKARICAIVKERLMKYYNDGRIQPTFLFSDVLRKISHVFYNQKSDESSIEKYVDDIFFRLNCITNLHDIIESKFL